MKWSHIAKTFIEADLELKSYPHTDAFVIEAHIDKVLVDNGSQADIIFHSTLLRMGYTDKDLEPSTVPLYGFKGKKVELEGKIKLPVSFGDISNTRIKFITFNVVKLNYPYFAILGRATINTFEAMIHKAYLRLKIPAAREVITVKGDRQLARNIEKGFTLVVANIHNIEVFTRVHLDEEERRKARQEEGRKSAKEGKAKVDNEVISVQPYEEKNGSP